MIGGYQVGAYQPFPAYQQEEGAGPAIGFIPAGSAGKRKHRYYYVEIDGQQFIADNADHARAILDRAAELASVSANQQADAITSRLKRAKRIGLATPKVSTDAPINLQPYMDRIRAAYRQAGIDAEIRMRMAEAMLIEQRMRDEDEAAAMLLLM